MAAEQGWSSAEGNQPALAVATATATAAAAIAAVAAVADLEGLRRRIDHVDDRIVDLLDERAGLMGSVAAAKHARSGRGSGGSGDGGAVVLHDPTREDALIERVCARARRFPPRNVARVYAEIMSACLSLQQRGGRSS